jgi:hypothetical protein
MDETTIRDHIRRVLDWEDAHATFEAAVADVPAAKRGVRPENCPHSVWELVEHIRIAQHDILDFCVNPNYKQMKWPDEYWPESPAPWKDADWDKSLAAVRQDRSALQRLAMDDSIDLGGRIPHGTGQTYLRELLLVADHTAYHVAQIVMVRQLLGVWKK